VKVPPPNEVDAIRIIMGIKDRYEKFHAVSYTDAAIEFAVSHSNRYIPIASCLTRQSTSSTKPEPA